MKEKQKTILDLLKEFAKTKDEVSGNSLNISWETIADGSAFQKFSKSKVDKWIKKNPYSPKNKK